MTINGTIITVARLDNREIWLYQNTHNRWFGVVKLPGDAIKKKKEFCNQVERWNEAENGRNQILDFRAVQWDSYSFIAPPQYLLNLYQHVLHITSRTVSFAGPVSVYLTLANNSVTSKRWNGSWQPGDWKEDRKHVTKMECSMSSSRTLFLHLFSL